MFFRCFFFFSLLNQIDIISQREEKEWEKTENFKARETRKFCRIRYAFVAEIKTKKETENWDSNRRVLVNAKKRMYFIELKLAVKQNQNASET